MPAFDFSQATIDEVRQYWDRRPCNIRHSPQPVGTRAYFDEVGIASPITSSTATSRPGRWSWLPQPAFRWLEKRFGWHLCLTAEAG